MLHQFRNLETFFTFPESSSQTLFYFQKVYIHIMGLVCYILTLKWQQIALPEGHIHNLLYPGVHYTEGFLGIAEVLSLFYFWVNYVTAM